MSASPHHANSQSRSHIAIIGAGPGGICMGIKLLAAGYRDFVILEQASELGGTWWHNRYPGAACDVPSHLYSFSFEIKRDWSCPYATAPEILDYMRACADKYQITPHIRFDTPVSSASWDEDTALWRIACANGAHYEAQILIAAQGMFNEASWPDLPGLTDFAGTAFHTARWDHGHNLTGKHVGIIGSAASAVQCIPEIAKLAAHLTVFQRTPNWVLPKNDDPYRPDKLEYFKHAPDAVEQNRARLFKEFDGFALLNDAERYASSVAACLANIALVENRETRDLLTPRYSFGCKRVLLSGKYYQSFNRDNVTLNVEDIDAITTRGLRTRDGVEHQLDTLIYATGFKVSRYLSALQVTGRDGLTLEHAWRDGAQAYLGVTTAGFPNLFQLYGPNTNKGSILFMIECQAGYIVRQLTRLATEQWDWLDVRAEAMADYNEGIQRDANGVSVWAEPCNNYFRDPASGRVVTQYPRDMTQYRKDTSRADSEAYVVGKKRRAS
jgi:cyclohexanone monooxygenase